MKKIIILLLFPLVGTSQTIVQHLSQLTQNSDCVQLVTPIRDTLQSVVIRDGFLKMETVVRVVTSQKEEVQFETYKRKDNPVTGWVYASTTANDLTWPTKTIKVPCKSHYEDLKGNKIQTYKLIAEW